MSKKYSIKDRLFLASCIFYIPTISYLIAYVSESALLLCICTFIFYSFWYIYVLHHSQKAEILYCNIIPMPITDTRKYLFLCKQVFKDNIFIYFAPQFLLYTLMFLLFPKLQFAGLLCILIVGVYSILFHVFAAEWSRRKLFGLYFYRHIELISGTILTFVLLEIPFIFLLSDISAWTIFATLLLFAPVFFFAMRILFLKIIRSYPFESETLKIKQVEKMPLF